MPLPKQIQAQLDAAEATLKQAYPETHGLAEGQPAVAEPVPPIPVPTVQASDPQPPASPQPVVLPQPPPPSEDWEQKYRTLQGIHNKHVGDLKSRVEQLEASNQQLLDKLSASMSAPAQAQPATANPQDVETFGEDLVRMIQRTAEQMLGPVAQSVEQRLAQLESNLQGTNKVVAQTADDSFFAALREQVPDFDSINTSEPFLAWLAEEDDLTGNQRQAALTAAGNSRDLKRVVKVFNTFKKAVGVEAAAPASNTSRLEAQVSPKSTGNGAAQATATASGKPMITVEQVERFYADVRRGAYRGNDKLRADTEAVINDALAENRIVQRGMPRPTL